MFNPTPKNRSNDPLNTPPPIASRDARLKKNGGWLVLATASAIGIISLWEDGVKPPEQTVVYADKLAKGLPTTCYGITSRATKEPVIVGDIWSRERCDRVFGDVLQNTQYGILNCIKAPISQNTFDAFTSFAHNVGVAGACASRAAALLDAGDTIKGCTAISLRPDGTPNWSYTIQGAEVKFVQGLFNRRKDETNLCLKP